MRAELTYLRNGANPLAVIGFSLLGAALHVAIGVVILAHLPLSDWLEALD